MKLLPQIDEQVEMGSLRYEDAIYDYKTWQVVPECIPNELVSKFSEQFRMFDRRDSGVIKIEVNYFSLYIYIFDVLKLARRRN